MDTQYQYRGDQSRRGFGVVSVLREMSKTSVPRRHQWFTATQALPMFYRPTPECSDRS